MFLHLPGESRPKNDMQIQAQLNGYASRGYARSELCFRTIILEPSFPKSRRTKRSLREIYHVLHNAGDIRKIVWAEKNGYECRGSEHYI